MNSPGGAATQICAPQFDRRFFSLPAEIQRQIQSKIDELGVNCAAFRIIGCKMWMRSDCGWEIFASFTSSTWKRTRCF